LSFKAERKSLLMIGTIGGRDGLDLDRITDPQEPPQESKITGDWRRFPLTPVKS